MSLVITNLSKTFDGVPALDRVSLVLNDGVIYGLFGRNGAGKSTLMAAIANRIVPSGGSITLDGANALDNERAQERIYLVNETLPFLMAHSLNGFFRDEERFYGGFDWALAARMLAAFDIDPVAKYGSLSLGSRMIARLIAALCVPVDVLLLDEPVLGLDAVNRELFYRFLLEAYAERPRTIVISTHIIDEIAHVIEHAIILEEGQVFDDFAVDRVARRAAELTGPADVVEEYAAGRWMPVMQRHSLGAMVELTVRGEVDAADLPEGVTARPLGLQEYCVRLTSSYAQASAEWSRRDGIEV
ncbi:ATP-binding cassette domain-containing protein [Bifidobacterium eulemuris]|uniref:ABC transporter n=1 Tax=Bifidobacterium eulemuris TaxID=1765219 RepID=A0A261G9M4_9BIFI|nr:ABC transporter ATP-binding protein [Bifidobacterium eulemuris]OZG68104.1 ABC transporter [Bifidobacterium eulemuris]QOL31829.1 ABC transporter ATP-binding protein [Bifidobacterium eulemuris]